jgi:apolipoprotein N-acyltransferase
VAARAAGPPRSPAGGSAGYFVSGLYWIGYAFLVDAPTFAWLLLFAVLGLPAICPVQRWLRSRYLGKDGPRVIALAAV